MSNLLFLNQQSLQQLFVGILLSLLTSMAIGLPIVMTVIAQQTQGDAETVSDENMSELESQSQAPHNSGKRTVMMLKISVERIVVWCLTCCPPKLQ